MGKLAALAPYDTLLRAVSLQLETERQFLRAADPWIVWEMSLLKMAELPRLRALENALSGRPASGPPPAAPERGPRFVSLVPAPSPEAAAAPPAADPAAEFVRFLTGRRVTVGSYVSLATRIAASGDELVIEFPIDKASAKDAEQARNRQAPRRGGEHGIRPALRCGWTASRQRGPHLSAPRRSQVLSRSGRPRAGRPDGPEAMGSSRGGRGRQGGRAMNIRQMMKQAQRCGQGADRACGAATTAPRAEPSPSACPDQGSRVPDRQGCRRPIPYAAGSDVAAARDAGRRWTSPSSEDVEDAGEGWSGFDARLHAGKRRSPDPAPASLESRNGPPREEEKKLMSCSRRLLSASPPPSNAPGTVPRAPPASRITSPLVAGRASTLARRSCGPGARSALQRVQHADRGGPVPGVRRPLPRRGTSLGVVEDAADAGDRRTRGPPKATVRRRLAAEGWGPRMTSGAPLARVDEGVREVVVATDPNVGKRPRPHPRRRSRRARSRHPYRLAAGRGDQIRRRSHDGAVAANRRD